MKAYVKTFKQMSRAMDRVSNEIMRYAPAGVTFTQTPEEADFVLLHAIGDCPDVLALVHRFKNEGKRVGVMQYCLRSTQHPSTAAWSHVWEAADIVWSYYDLHEMLREDGVTCAFNFYHAPMGADASVFTVTKDYQKRAWQIATSGYIAWCEGVDEAAEACRIVGKRMFHLGPDLQLGRHVDYGQNIDDSLLAYKYAWSYYVAGLRRGEGFEMPAAEGVLCGARPIMFDRPHYRAWFNDLAIFVPENDQLTASLVDVFNSEYRPVTNDEKQIARVRFDWATLCGGMWERL